MKSFVIAFLLGICLLSFCRTIPPLLPITIIAIVTFLIILILKMLPFKVTFIYKKILLFIFAVTIGFLYCSSMSLLQIKQSLPTSLEGKPLEVLIRVQSLPEVKPEPEKEGQVYRFEALILKTFPESLWPNPGKIRLKWQDPEEKIAPGSVWRFTVKLKRPRNYANPGSFDYEKYAFANHWLAQGYVLNQFSIERLSSSTFFGFVDNIRSYFLVKMQELLKNQTFGSLIIALILGYRTDILSEHWQAFQATGTSHLMAISGLHIGLVSSMIFSLSQFFWKKLPKLFLKVPAQIAAASLTLIFSFLYALLAGFSIPTQRAFIMITLFMLGILFRRTFSVWRSFYMALLIVLLKDPLSTLTPGFWLSFLAVGIMLYGMQHRLAVQGFWFKWCRPQWIVFLGLFPITLLIFNQVSLISPLANMLAIPWVSFCVVPFALLGTLMIPISNTLAQFLLQISAQSFSLIWPLLQYLENVKYAVWQNDPSLLTLTLCLIACLWLISPKGFPGKRMALVFILPLFFFRQKSIPDNTAYITILDVGQGLSAVIETKNHVLIYDTGPKLSPTFDTGDRVVIPYLKKRNKNFIDTIIISHSDNDHIGGLSSILKKIEVNEIISSFTENIDHPKIQKCFAGQSFDWDGVHFEILNPSSRIHKKRNDDSCVLRVSVGNQSFLLTGDIEQKSEMEILKQYQHNLQKLRSHFMLVPHHGSKTSSSIEFLNAINPKYAIIPVGYRNSYGHPKAEIIARYQKLDIQLLDSVHDGAIFIKLQNKEELEIPISYRAQYKKFWHQ